MIFLKSVKVCDFGKEVKKKLVDLEQTQEWLMQQVREDTGLFIDSSYLHKILTGKLATPKIVESISRILSIDIAVKENSPSIEQGANEKQVAV